LKTGGDFSRHTGASTSTIRGDGHHLHVLVRLDPEVAQGWSDLDVVQRWGRLFPPRDKSRRPIPVTEFKLVEYTGRLVRQGKASISAASLHITHISIKT
jgi:hypothetical protein